MGVQDLQRRWERSREALRAIAAGIPEGKEGFCPATGTMSLGGLVLHVISAEKTAREALTSTPERWEWKTDIDGQHYPEIAGILAVLDSETSLTHAYLARLQDSDLARKIALPWGGEMTLEDLWYAWLFHEIHHRGNLVTGLRVAGVVPPDIW